jgi:hypothetical protein
MLKNHLQTLFPTIIWLSIISIFLSGCADSGLPFDQVFTPPAFSVTLEINPDQETHGTMIVSNSSNHVFPADDTFEGEMYLWDHNAILRSKLEAHSIGKLQPGESVHLASWRWRLDPGVYFLTWGSSKYGGVITVFSVIENENRLSLGESQSARTKPPSYTVNTERAGSVEVFTLKNDGTLILRGETTLPEDRCIFPLLLEHESILEVFPFGQCANISDGSWTWQTPSEPGSLEVNIKPETSYKVILLSDDLATPPSEPFEINISPPVHK